MKKEAKLKTFSTWEKVTKKRNLLLKHVHTTVSPGFHFLNAHVKQANALKPSVSGKL